MFNMDQTNFMTSLGVIIQLSYWRMEIDRILALISDNRWYNQSSGDEKHTNIRILTWEPQNMTVMFSVDSPECNV